jgi:tRNA pseudouridine synthase 10
MAFYNARGSLLIRKNLKPIVEQPALTDPNLFPHSIAEIVACVERTAAPFEFRTFVIGFTRPESYSRPEHEARFRALKVQTGDALEARWPGRVVDFVRPEVRFDVRLDLRVDLQIAPLFLAGRYRKLSREIPSTRWIHHRCQGRGCPQCGHTGNLCGPSVEELVGGPALAQSGGEATLFHGLGREDTDVRMLGRGRPFVLEIFRPFRRSLDLAALAAAIRERAEGLAEISLLAVARREAARAVKSAAAEKTYRAWVEAAGPLPADAAARAASLSGAQVRQLSPLRVADRRGRLTLRTRRVVESRWLGPFEGSHLWEVRAEAGTYIKELISGDQGRTTPSLTDLLGVSCRCAALDVLEVHWEPPWESRPAGS